MCNKSYKSKILDQLVSVVSSGWIYFLQEAIVGLLTKLSVDGLLILLTGYLTPILRILGLPLCFHLLSRKYPPALVQNYKTSQVPNRKWLFYVSAAASLAVNVCAIYQFGKESSNLTQTALVISLMIELNWAYEVVAMLVLGVAVATFKENSQWQLLHHLKSTEMAGILGQRMLEDYNRLRTFLSPILFMAIMTNGIGKLSAKS